MSFLCVMLPWLFPGPNDRMSPSIRNLCLPLCSVKMLEPRIPRSLPEAVLAAETVAARGLLDDDEEDLFRMEEPTWRSTVAPPAALLTILLPASPPRALMLLLPPPPELLSFPCCWPMSLARTYPDTGASTCYLRSKLRRTLENHQARALHNYRGFILIFTQIFWIFSIAFHLAQGHQITFALTGGDAHNIRTCFAYQLDTFPIREDGLIHDFPQTPDSVYTEFFSWRLRCHCQAVGT